MDAEYLLTSTPSARRHLAKPGGLGVADRVTDPDQLGRRLLGDAGLGGDDLLLDVRRREAELDSDHPLARGVLEVLEDALVAGVVRHDEAEAGRGGEADAEAVDRELPTVVRQRGEHHGGGLPS